MMSKNEVKGFKAIRNKQFANFKSELEKQKTPKYLTRKQVSELLCISLPTIWRYSKQGILTSYCIGSRVLYKENEVNASVIKLKR